MDKLIVDGHGWFLIVNFLLLHLSFSFDLAFVVNQESLNLLIRELFNEPSIDDMTLSFLVLIPGKATISNDGATIMKLLDVVHPAAKTLVEIAKSQDAEVSRMLRWVTFRISDTIFKSYLNAKPCYAFLSL